MLVLCRHASPPAWHCLQRALPVAARCDKPEAAQRALPTAPVCRHPSDTARSHLPRCQDLHGCGAGPLTQAVRPVNEPRGSSPGPAASLSGLQRSCRSFLHSLTPFRGPRSSVLSPGRCDRAHCLLCNWLDRCWRCSAPIWHLTMLRLLRHLYCLPRAAAGSQTLRDACTQPSADSARWPGSQVTTQHHGRLPCGDCPMTVPDRGSLPLAAPTGLPCGEVFQQHRQAGSHRDGSVSGLGDTWHAARAPGCPGIGIGSCQQHQHRQLAMVSSL